MRARVRLDARARGQTDGARPGARHGVCEGGGVPNLSECWSDGTATFMVCGERVAQACGTAWSTAAARNLEPGRTRTGRRHR